MVEYVNKGLFGVWSTGVWGLSWELRESRRAIVLKPIKDLWYGMGVGAWGVSVGVVARLGKVSLVGGFNLPKSVA